MRKAKGVLKLTRYKDYIGNKLILTALALILSSRSFDMKSVLVVIANLLASSYIFMINDVEDAEDDRKDPKKKNRNPLSAGMLSRTEGYIISFLTAFASLLLYYLLGRSTFVWGTIALVTGTLYSWRKVRLKSLPFLDLLSHGVMLGLALYLAAFTVDNSRLTFLGFIVGLVPFLLSISGHMEGEVVDYKYDKEAKLKNTASVLGVKLLAKLLFLVRLILIPTIIIYVALNVSLREYIFAGLFFALLGLTVFVSKKARNKIIPLQKNSVEPFLFICGLGLIAMTYISEI